MLESIAAQLGGVMHAAHVIERMQALNDELRAESHGQLVPGERTAFVANQVTRLVDGEVIHQILRFLRRFLSGLHLRRN